MLPLPTLEDGYLRKLFEYAAYGFYRHRLLPGGWRLDSHARTAPEVGHLGCVSRDVNNPPRHAGRRSAGAPGPIGRRAAPNRDRHQVHVGNQAKHYRNGTLASGYVYQIYTYLMSQDGREPDAKSEGLMLHPTIGDHLDEEVVIQRHAYASRPSTSWPSPRRSRTSCWPPFPRGGRPRATWAAESGQQQTAVRRQRMTGRDDQYQVPRRRPRRRTGAVAMSRRRRG